MLYPAYPRKEASRFPIQKISIICGTYSTVEHFVLHKLTTGKRKQFHSGHSTKYREKDIAVH
jgi:hypothetical protein